MYSILIEECFGSPQLPRTQSESFVYNVDTQAVDLDVECLKENIVRRRFPRFSDASCITIVLREGPDVLVDEMPVSSLQAGPSLLALASQTPEEATHVQVSGGVNVPPVLYIYGPDRLKYHCKLPESINGTNAGTWVSGEIPWSASVSQLGQHLATVGFDRDLVEKELRPLAGSDSLDLSAQPTNWGAGRLGPILLYRLCKSAEQNGRESSAELTSHGSGESTDLDGSEAGPSAELPSPGSTRSPDIIDRDLARGSHPKRPRSAKSADLPGCRGAHSAEPDDRDLARGSHPKRLRSAKSADLPGCRGAHSAEPDSHNSRQPADLDGPGCAQSGPLDGPDAYESAGPSCSGQSAKPSAQGAGKLAGLTVHSSGPPDSADYSGRPDSSKGCGQLDGDHESDNGVGSSDSDSSFSSYESDSDVGSVNRDDGDSSGQSDRNEGPGSGHSSNQSVDNHGSGLSDDGQSSDQLVNDPLKDLAGGDSDESAERNSGDPAPSPDLNDLNDKSSIPDSCSSSPSVELNCHGSVHLVRLNTARVSGPSADVKGRDPGQSAEDGSSSDQSEKDCGPAPSTDLNDGDSEESFEEGSHSTRSAQEGIDSDQSEDGGSDCDTSAENDTRSGKRNSSDAVANFNGGNSDRSAKPNGHGSDQSADTRVRYAGPPDEQDSRGTAQSQDSNGDACTQTAEADGHDSGQPAEADGHDSGHPADTNGCSSGEKKSAGRNVCCSQQMEAPDDCGSMEPADVNSVQSIDLNSTPSAHIDDRPRMVRSRGSEPLTNLKSLGSRETDGRESGHSADLNGHATGQSVKDDSSHSSEDLNGSVSRESDGPIPAESAELKISGSDRFTFLLRKQEEHFEKERREHARRIKALKLAHADFQEQIDSEIQNAKEVAEDIETLQQEHEKVSQQTSEIIYDVKVNLLKTVTCPRCSNQYKSDDAARNPIHLSCGHIFCRRCLRYDWLVRAVDRVQPITRCFHECEEFDHTLLVDNPHYVIKLMEAWKRLSDADAARPARSLTSSPS